MATTNILFIHKYADHPAENLEITGKWPRLIQDELLAQIYKRNIDPKTVWDQGLFGSESIVSGDESRFGWKHIKCEMRGCRECAAGGMVTITVSGYSLREMLRTDNYLNGPKVKQPRSVTATLQKVREPVRPPVWMAGQ